MLKLDTMELADAFSPKELVDEIYRQCPDITPPVPVKELAYAAGIIKIEPIDTESIEGMLVTGEGKEYGVIYFNKSNNRPIGRQRFTIGHELGHFLLLHHNGNRTCSNADVSFSSYSLDTIEKEANDFSQLLLLPEHLLKKEFDSLLPSIENLQEISDLFQMSFEATANKCTKYGSKPFALFYSKDDKLRYCWRDFKKVPYALNIDKGELLPESSQARQLKVKEQSVSEEVRVQASCWFKNTEKHKLPEIMIEQTFFQKNGYKVTLLREK
ncbi:ImmA/IrrE family metallo-endopeptidase [Aliikangiella maris]|uniref:ImmA/IrrE family metallo-endopeptidase n=2 Tax=Aliikangiella maris TaxID=3162458 RepID=A0ABV3MIK7_9GAMM